VEVVEEELAEWPEGSTGCGAGGLLLLMVVESVVGTEGCGPFPSATAPEYSSM
jgi:hypothetical protein